MRLKPGPRPFTRQLGLALLAAAAFALFAQIGATVTDAAGPKLSFVESHRDGVGGVDGLDGTQSAIVSPDGKHVYATGLRDDAVAVFRRSSTNGSLSFVAVY